MSDIGGLYTRVMWPAGAGDRQAKCDEALEHLVAGRVGRAAALYGRLLPAAGELARPVDCCLLAEQAALSFFQCGRLNESAACLESAEGEARTAGDPARQASVMRGLAAVSGMRGDIERLAALGHEAFRLLAQVEDPGARADFHATLARVHAARNEFGKAIREDRRAFLASRRLPPRRRLLYAHALMSGHAAAHEFGRVRRLLGVAGSLARAARPPAADHEAWKMLVSALLHRFERDLSGALRDALEAARRCEALGMLGTAARALDLAALLADGAGFYSSALRLADRMARYESAIGAGGGAAPEWRRPAFRACLLLGLGERLLPLAPRLRSWAEKPDSAEATSAIFYLRRYAELRGDWKEARRRANAGIARLQGQRRDPDRGPRMQWGILEHHVALATIALAEGRESPDRDGVGRGASQARRTLAALSAAWVREAPPELRSQVDLVESEILLAEGKPRDAAARARRAWVRVRRSDDPAMLIETATALLVAQLEAGEAGDSPGRRGGARESAETLRWILAWNLGKLDAGHRASFLAAPVPRRAVEAIRRAGLKPPGPSAPDVPRPAVRYPRLDSLDRAWEIVRAADAEGIPSEEPILLRQERKTVERAVLEAGGNISRAARALRISRSTLRKKIARFGIQVRR